MEPMKTHTEPSTAVVIGAGFGGLALAIRLQAAGVQTTAVREARQARRPGLCLRRTRASPSTPGRRSSPTRRRSRSCSRCRGRRLSDYVELLPVAPFYRLCWEDGTVFDYANDQAALDRQIAALQPGRRRRVPPLPRLLPGGVRGRLRQARHGALPVSFAAWSQAGPQLAQAAGLAQRLRHGVALHPGRAAAPGVLVPFAAGRRQSVRDVVRSTR